MEHVYNLTMEEAVTKYNQHFGEKLTVLSKKEIEVLTAKEYGSVSSCTTLPSTGFQVWFTPYGVEHIAGVLNISFQHTTTPAA